MKDAPETNKFMGLRYYAVGSNNKIISEGSSPDDVYYDAVSKGEQAPIVFGSNTIIDNTKMSHRPQELKTYKHQKLMNEFNDMMIKIKKYLFVINERKMMGGSILKPINISKPTVEELDSLTNKIMTVLQEDKESQIKY
jgi:hypothetical protein